MRGHAASVLVAVVSSAFGVSLLAVTGVLSQMISADPMASASPTVRAVLTFIALVFLAIALYVAALVTANTFATVVAGRSRTIALYRLIGSSARAQRRSVAREGLLVGIVGSLVGAAVGVLAAMALVAAGVAFLGLPDLGYRFVEPVTALPIVAVVATTWAASWVGSRRVLRVSPMEATGAAQERGLDETTRRLGRNVAGLVLFLAGDAVLVFGMLVGLVSPAGVLIGVVGGILSFSGVVAAAGAIMPRALRVVGRLFGRGATARLAAENAVRYPERSTRTTIGLVIGVTLVTTFSVTIESFRALVHAANAAQPRTYEGVDPTLDTISVVFEVLIGFSALLAAIGMVNNLSLTVLQRTRELGLLRALGFSVAQVRRMVVAESAQLTIASVVLGLLLGTFYGWVGAQSLLGSISGSPGIVAPAVPLVAVGVIVALGAVLSLAASVAPARRATRVAPVRALAVD
ncbi:FtsX-like permease family protein [Galbitalea sp. SE-J8]|uniref:ABC transporter permease n=1 Tax=Galbitalea sp. SE-J8 TaxID=3054952 RepID=UPI00259CCA88|nr:FtsX-like permease family protein [Galbitalea sp. SE-J8]MDM4761831.1 FtsX-like permease family protein [Galbitalea sp. SE-J8]